MTSSNLSSGLARLSSAAWSLLIVGLGISSGVWLELRAQQSAAPIIIGLYGEAQLSLRCPAEGYVAEMRVALGDAVTPEMTLGLLSLSDDAALLDELQRARALAEAEIDAQLASLDVSSTTRAFEMSERRERARAAVFSVEGELKRAEAQLKTLERSLKSVEAGVRAGSITLAELTRLKSQAAGLRRLASPLTQQRGAWRKLMRLEPDVKLSQALEALRAALTRQRSLWESAEEANRARVNQRRRLSAPTRALVASQPLPPGSRCSAGEVVLSLQPTAPVVRLWRLSGDQTPARQTPLKVNLATPRYQRRDASPQRVMIDQVGASLIPLPEHLQPAARQALRLSSLLTLLNNEPPPLVRGLPMRARLPDLNNGASPHMPWGAVITVTP